MAVVPTIKICGINQQQFGALLVIGFQIIIIILFGIFTKYSDDASPARTTESTTTTESTKPTEITKPNELDVYPMFMDTHVMIFVGFGFLMTFLKRYTFGGVAFNFLVAALIIQWAILSDGFYHFDENYKIAINLGSLLSADIAAAAVLISMGAVLGRTTYVQLLVMGIIEIAIYSANNYLADKLWKVSDAGASMFVHTFGAYFGLGVSYVLNFKKGDESESDFESSYTSDTFAMVGSLFLWMFWPSFNAAEVSGDSQHRAIINTYISLASCCVTTFIMSYLLSPEKKFDMVHIQNSSLAGGVAVGATADLMVQPWGAMLIGMVAACVSVFGYTTISPFLAKRCRIPDTCGVHNLHGMPGVLAGIVGVVMAALATSDLYHFSLYNHYPAMAPTNMSDIQNLGIWVTPGDGRTPAVQAGYQMIALIVTMSIAIVGGLLTGFIISCKPCNQTSDVANHIDDHFWEIAHEHKPATTTENHETP